MRIRSLCVMLLAGLVVAGCDSDCPTPTSPTSPNPGLTAASLTISGPSELQVGQTAQLTATARFSDGSSQNVTSATTWVTNDVNVCTINAAGVVTSVSAGQCTVTGVFNNISGTIVITCFNSGNPPGTPNPPPTGPPPTGPPPTPPPSGGSGLVIEGPSSVAVGSGIQLRAYTVDGRQEVTNQANWSGNNPGVASVGNEGRVNGQSVGSVNVTASYQGQSGSKTVAVTSDGNPPVCPGGAGCPPPVCTMNCPAPGKTLTGLAIQGMTTFPVGQTSQLSAVASFSDNTTENVTGQTSWTSANSGIAPVNSTGLVTGAAAGTAVISASYQGQNAAVNVTITGGGPPPPPTVNSLAVTGTSPLTVGQSAQYSAVASLSDGTTSNVNGQSQWSSSNPGVATVSSTGNVTAVAAGQTTISATYQGKSGAVPLTVNAAQPDLIGLELRIGANVLTGNGPLGLNLNLADLINGNPIVDLRVFGLYSDGSKQDVTSLSVINSPLLSIDGQGVAEIVSLLLRGLLQPNAPINVTYGGFTANVNVQLQLPVLQSLGFPSNNISVVNGNKLPSLSALFSQGINSTVDAGFPGIQHALTVSGPIAGLINPVLALLGLNLNQIVNVTSAGVVQVLNQNALNQLTAVTGGLLPLNLTSTLNGVTTAPITLNLR